MNFEVEYLYLLLYFRYQLMGGLFGFSKTNDNNVVTQGY